MFADYIFQANGGVLFSVRATTTSIAIKMTTSGLRNYWSRRPTHDVTVYCQGQVMAVLSNRGKAAPDVMILEYMRRRIIEAN